MCLFLHKELWNSGYHFSMDDTGNIVSPEMTRGRLSVERLFRTTSSLQGSYKRHFLSYDYSGPYSLTWEDTKNIMNQEVFHGDKVYISLEMTQRTVKTLFMTSSLQWWYREHPFSGKDTGYINCPELIQDDIVSLGMIQGTFICP